MAIRKPFNLTAWIEENRDLLKPPVGNKNLYVDSGDYIVMIVAGQRTEGLPLQRDGGAVLPA